jgi:GNAT superfamily N-acetyltransferase
MQIRLYQDGDEQGFMALDKMVEINPWNRRTLSNWQWKYKGPNPAGQSLMVVADHEGEVVGFFSALPMNYWLGGEEVLGSHSIAMMIKPEWQNKGLIKFVADRLIKEISERKILFTYGFPNDNAYALHVKHLGYRDISQQKLLERKLGVRVDVELNRFTAGLEFNKINRFDDSVIDLWDEAKKHLKIALIRTPDFLNWRYIERPDVNYYAFGAYRDEKLAGYCVLKLYREGKLLRGHFLDLFTVPDDKEVGQFLVQQSLVFFKNEKVDEVNLWMQGSVYLKEILFEYGFRNVSTRPMICRFNFEAEKLESLLTEENWYFTMGDTQEIY